MTGPRHPSQEPSHELFLTELFREPLDPGYADAAERRAAAETAPAPRRNRARSAALVALLAVGVLLAVAYQQVVAAEPTRAEVRDDLQEQIRERGDLADALQARAEQLRDEVGDLRDRELADPEVRQLRELEAAVGLVRVRGDGLVIELDDGPGEVDSATGTPVVEPEARILDVDLQLITNTLWAAGAEAIAVNDRRLTSNSTIRGASGAILIDRVPVAGPYQVEAIGSDDLAELFNASATGGEMRGLVQEFGITYEVREEQDLSLPAATAPQLHYAEPLEVD